MTTLYQHTTLGDFKSALAARLGDFGQIHWISDELGLYAIESIQLFNSLALGYHRDTASFNTSTTTPFHDLPTELPTLRPYTTKDQTSIALIQYQFMEPKSVLVSATTASEMWSFDEILRAIQRRRDQFLSDTGCVVTNHTYPIGPVAYFDLPDSVIAIRRAVWKSPEGRYTNLFGSDETTFITSPSWRQSTSTPTRYSIISSAPLRMQFDSTFQAPGTLDLLVVESGTPLNPTANTNAGTLLGVPDDFAWGPRFGAMADLLRKEGPARDPSRADFCESVYQMAVDLCNQSSVLLTATIRDVAIPIRSLAQLDALRPGWQGQNTDTPASVATAGLNLIAAYPLPDGAYPISLSVVRNALIPSSSTANTEYLQISRDDVPGLLSWAEMLASFKSEGSSLESARKGSQLLLERASSFVGRRLSMSSFGRNVFGFSRDDFTIRPLASDASRSPQSQTDVADSASRHQSRARSNAVRRTRLGGR